MFSANVTAVSTLLLILEISLIGFFSPLQCTFFIKLNKLSKKIGFPRLRIHLFCHFLWYFCLFLFFETIPVKICFSYFCCFWFDIQLAFAAFLPLILLLVTQRHDLSKFVPDMLSINAYNPIIFFLASLSIWANL